MPADHFTSPNAIPPRTSSTQHSHHRSTSNSIGSTAAAAKIMDAGGAASTSDGASGTLTKPALRPVSEGSWIGQSHRGGASHSENTIRASPASTPHHQVNGPSGSRAQPILDGAAEHRTRDGVSDERPRNGTQAGTADEAAAAWTPQNEALVLGPYTYLHDRPGKNMRTQLVSAFNHWLRVPAPRLAIITQVVGMLHTASLLIDDIEDSAELRRGVPVAHNIFGTAQTLNSANYVYFCALQELLKLGNPKFTAIYAEELCNLHRGQGMDLYWRDTLTCPTEAEYLEMVGNKTAGLFRLAIKLMQAESASEKDFVPLANLMGIIFQIRDDYLNLWSPAYAENKGLCEDLTEGKFSFPIIHAVRADPGDAQLRNILRQRPTDPAVKRYAVDHMERAGSFAHCRRAVRSRVERALGLVAALDGDGDGKGNAEVKAILNHFLLD